MIKAIKYCSCQRQKYSPNGPFTHLYFLSLFAETLDYVDLTNEIEE